MFHQIMAIYVQSTSAGMMGHLFVVVECSAAYRSPVLLISRTYALYLRNKAILVFLLGLALTCLGIDIVRLPAISCEAVS